MIADADHDDVVWLAGLLEGEGAFDLHRGKYPRVRVAMTDRDVVGRVATLFGSSIRLTLRTPPHKAIWHAELQGARAADVMRAVLPHMGSRRSGKIGEILAVALFGATGNDTHRGVAFGRELGRPPGLISPGARVDTLSAA